MNIFAKNFRALKELLVFQPPANPPPFVLKEAEAAGGATRSGASPLGDAARQHEALLRYARRVTATLEKARQFLADPLPAGKLATLRAELAALEQQQEQLSPVLATYSLTQDQREQAVSASLTENRLTLERIYNLPDNKDLIIRSITIPASPPIAADLAYLDGLVDNKIINLAVLQPLMLMGNQDQHLYQQDVLHELITKHLPGNQVKIANTMRDVTNNVNRGDTAIFLDGVSTAIIVETKGQEHRGIDRPAIEQSVRGSQASFTETLRVNTGLMRSILRTSDLTTELLTVGIRSNTTCAIMYLKPIINPTIVQEVKRRINSLKVDSIVDSGTLELLIEDWPVIPYPRALVTERPDRAAAALAEGRLAILVDGSPFALVVPISLFTLFHSADDFAFSWLGGTVSRILRFLGAGLTLILPSAYIAVSYFHPEALPAELVLAIAGAREKVPFPSVLEIAMMEASFELLREAGVRIPGMLGPTIGIVGAIILGQAAVAANIVSPITVMIIAVTGLASFAIPDYSLAIAIRLTRFAFEVLAAIFGLVGVASGLLAVTMVLCSLKSMGVPYLSPVGPKTKAGYDMVLRGPVYSQELRPDELNPRDEQRQASISRPWTRERPAGEEDES